MNMGESDDRSDGIPFDSSKDIHVSSTIKGWHIFYTESLDEYIRTDRVMDIPSNR